MRTDERRTSGRKERGSRIASNERTNGGIIPVIWARFSSDRPRVKLAVFRLVSLCHPSIVSFVASLPHSQWRKRRVATAQERTMKHRSIVFESSSWPSMITLYHQNSRHSSTWRISPQLLPWSSCCHSSWLASNLPLRFSYKSQLLLHILRIPRTPFLVKQSKLLLMLYVILMVNLRVMRFLTRFSG